MAYDVNNLTKLGALKALAEKVARDYATKTELGTLADKVDGLVTAGGEPNVIEKIAVNGAEQTITDKTVDITVPTKVSDLTNDSKFQSDTEVATAIATAIAETGHASFKKVDAIPSAEEAEDNILYLVMNGKTKHYDIYAKIGDGVELLDDTTVDLSGYVEKIDGMGLSSNDYTDAEKEKLTGIEIATDAEVAEMLAEVFGA